MKISAHTRRLFQFALAVLLVTANLSPVFGRSDDGHLQAETETAHLKEDCHSKFAVYMAAQPYIINPAVAARRKTTVVAVFEDATAEKYGAIAYRLEISNTLTGQVVHTTSNLGDLDLGASHERTFAWDATDSFGRPVPDGEYTIRMIGRFVEGERSSSLARRASPSLVDELDGVAPLAEGSDVTVVVDRAGAYDRLFDGSTTDTSALRASLDATFPYQFFYGTTHAHTSWSDGGMPANTSCKSGNYGYAGGSTPADAFTYARNQGGLDFLAVVEHNHLMQEACSGCTAQQVRDRYAAGFQAAITATVPGAFVGLFGMEWGTIDTLTGHINVYNQSKLISWSPEPADVTIAKNDYAALYTAMKNNAGAYGSYGTFNHPDGSNFNNYARTADGDSVMRGLSIVSGPAFSTATNFAPGGSRYTTSYNKALSLGWKIAPECHQDNHCWNYGTATPNRTVVLVPDGTTFNQQSLSQAFMARRFFAAEDRDVQLVYRTADNTRVMGDSFSASAAVNVSVALPDPGSEGVQKIEIWGGRAGTNASPGATATIVASNTGSTTLTTSLAPRTAGEEWYYYVLAVQADGNYVWSAPMWITWGSGGCTNPATPSLGSPASGATNVATSTTLSWAAVSGATSYDVYFGTAATPAFHQNVTGTSLAVSGLSNSTAYRWTVAARNSCGSSAQASVRTFTTAAATSTTTPIACAQSITGALATTDPRSTVRTTSYADTYTYAATAGTPLTITLNSTAFDAYLVLKNASGTVLAQDDDSNGGNNSKIVYTPTTSGTLSIEATSYAANATGSYTIALACSTGSTAVLSEGAEAGATGWQFLKNTGSGWAIEAASPHSGTRRFKTNVGYSTYLNSADWSLVSPTFSLAGKTSATLKYWFIHKTEASYDLLRVEVSTNGGTNWTTLATYSGTSSGYPAWAPQASINLTPYVGGSNVKIRFRFTSDGSVADWGVAVDDIEVTAQ